MNEKESGRRSFLKHLMAGTAVITGVAGTRKTARAKNERAVQQDQFEILYSETDNFKKYYKSLRS